MRGTNCEGKGCVLLLRSLKYHRIIAVDLSCNPAIGHPEFVEEKEPGKENSLEKAPIMKGLKALVKTNAVLTHLDLSWCSFRQDACRQLGQWLRSNKTLLGLHLTGQPCFVDPRGFVRVRHGPNQYASPDTSYATAPASIVDYPDNFDARPTSNNNNECPSGDGRCCKFSFERSIPIPWKRYAPYLASLAQQGCVVGGSR